MTTNSSPPLMVVLKSPGAPASAVSIRRMSEVEKLIGGTPCACFQLDTKYGRLHGYCDDDGISKRLPENFARPSGGWVIRGPIVVTTMAYGDEGLDWMPLSSELVAEALATFEMLGVESIPR